MLSTKKLVHNDQLREHKSMVIVDRWSLLKEHYMVAIVVDWHLQNVPKFVSHIR